MRRYPSGEVIARSLLAAAVLASAAACGAQSPSSASGSGLYGSVRVSPSSPVCLAGKACSKPAHGFKLVFSGGGRTVTARTDAHGRYRVRLARGRYLVLAAGMPQLPKRGLQPGAVTVPNGGFARRDFVYDPGIR
jgi:hypothetical protein